MTTVNLGLILYGTQALMFAVAGRDFSLTAHQFKVRRRFTGTPLLLNMGIVVGDTVLVNPTALYIWGHSHHEDWTLSLHPWCYLSPLIATAVINYFWAQGLGPDALACQRRLTHAGWLHVVYMIIVLPIICLYFFATWHPDLEPLRIIRIALIAHVWIGTIFVIDIRKGSIWVKLPNLLNVGAWLVALILSVSMWRVTNYLLEHRE